MSKPVAYMIRVLLDKNDILCSVKLDQTLDEIAKRTGKSVNEIVCEALRESKPLMNCNLPYEKLTPDDIVQISEHLDYSAPPFSIKRRSKDRTYCYYVHPSGDSYFEMTLENPDTGIVEHHTFTGPSNIINLDCHGRAMTELLDQITREYLEKQGVNRQPLWADFLNIPNDFLKIYGVIRLPKPDIMLSITCESTNTIISNNPRP